MEYARMHIRGFYWSPVWTSPYFLNQLTKASVDCEGLWPIMILVSLMGGVLSRRGGVFVVIQYHSDSIYRRVFLGTGSWSRSRRAAVHLKRLSGKKREWKLHHRLKKRPPQTTSVKLFNVTTAPHAQPTNATGLSNASQLASLKTDGIKVLIVSLPANYPSASIVLP